MNARGIPVVIAENGFGLPVTDATASGLGMPMTVAANGYGTPVVITTNGAGMAAVFDPPLAPLGPDETAPTITSSASVSNPENSTLAHLLVANEAVTWTKTGGADTARFEIVAGNLLRWLSNGTKDFEAPDDADTNNAYVVQVTATDAALNATNQTITVTVTNVTAIPVITSTATANNTEGVALAHSLTADQSVTWSIVGGADAARFEVSGSTLRWLSNGVKDYEAPNDADTNNAYIVQVRATNPEGTADQTVTVTVVDTGETTPSLSATLDLNFVANTSIIAGASSTSLAPITVTRNIAAWAENAAGVWSSFAVNTARCTDKGLLLEEARTNVCLQNRTLTNASWVKTNCTAVKDQVGIDAAASSASRITATAANATCLLTTTISSSVRFQTAFVKRLVGTGTIEMTQNGGTNWTAVTVTAGWTRVSVPSITIANPVVGFRIVTSGDSVAIDMVQNENGAYATSPMPTTTASAARTADVVIINTTVAPLASWFVAATGTLFAEGVPYNASLPTPIVFQLDNASTSLHYVGLPGATAAAGGTTTAGTAVGTFNGTYAAGTNKAAWAYAVNDMAGSHNGAAVVTDATGPTMPTGISTARLGKVVAATHWSGYLRRLVYFNTRLPNATLVTLTGATPVTITAPAVTGIVHVGQQLAATSGNWSGSPTGYTYQWMRVT